jgi:hypothetical protein
MDKNNVKNVHLSALHVKVQPPIAQAVMKRVSIPNFNQKKTLKKHANKYVQMNIMLTIIRIISVNHVIKQLTVRLVVMNLDQIIV